MESASEIPKVEKLQGRDGKWYTRRVKKAPPPPVPARDEMGEPELEAPTDDEKALAEEGGPDYVDPDFSPDDKPEPRRPDPRPRAPTWDAAIRLACQQRRRPPVA